MKRSKYLTFLAAAALVIAPFGDTQAVQIRGARSCGVWVQQTQEQGATLLASQAWLVGFLSGMAFESDKDFLEGTDNESLYLWVTNYCRANPLETLVRAAERLSAELAKKKGIRP